VAGTSSSAILAGFLIRPKDSQTNQSYLAKNVTQYYKDNAEKFFEKRKINVGALWVVTVIAAMMGAMVGYRIGVRIFANPKVEQTIEELKNVIKDLKKIKKAHKSQNVQRGTIQNDDSLDVKKATYTKAFKKLI
jgi:hypothetical protein